MKAHKNSSENDQKFFIKHSEIKDEFINQFLFGSSIK